MTPFSRVAFLGIGLINGSLARVLQRHAMAGEIVACARREDTRKRALELGLCSRIEADPAAAVQGADLVVLGVPPAAVGVVAAAMRPGLDPAAIITDVSSIKAQIVRDVVPHLPTPSLFVPGHPVAGTEHSGPDAAFGTLFERRRCILTPIEDTDPLAVERIRELWELAGSMVDVMTPEHHDRVLAITSHLPHLIAYTIVGTVAAWLVHGMDRDEAVAFGRVFRQNTILVCRGARPERLVTDPTCDDVGRAIVGNWRIRG